jgi:hypothetical protein
VRYLFVTVIFAMCACACSQVNASDRESAIAPPDAFECPLECPVQTAAATVNRITIGGAAAAAGESGNGLTTPRFVDGRWLLAFPFTAVYFPIALPAGCTVHGWSAGAIKASSPSETITASYIADATIVLDSVIKTGTGPVVIDGAAVDHPIEERHDYAIRVQRDSLVSSAPADVVKFAEVVYSCPAGGGAGGM